MFLDVRKTSAFNLVNASRFHSVTELLRAICVHNHIMHTFCCIIIVVTETYLVLSVLSVKILILLQPIILIELEEAKSKV